MFSNWSGIEIRAEKFQAVAARAAAVTSFTQSAVGAHFHSQQMIKSTCFSDTFNNVWMEIAERKKNRRRLSGSNSCNSDKQKDAIKSYH